MHYTILLAIVMGVFAAAESLAQGGPYAGLESREIKGLSEEEVAGYLAGKGMGMALPAELNGYPGPKHVLELDEALALSENQRAQLRKIFAAMQSEATELGKQLVAAEKALDTAFAEATVNEQSLITMTHEIGRLQGALRAAHLEAHLETKLLLTGAQLASYSTLRGYDHRGHGAGPGHRPVH